jgi:hypothetical protein
MNMDQMLLAPVETLEMPTPPDTSHLITEDDTPVDNLFSEKQQRLLTEPLYSSWSGPGRGGMPGALRARPYLVAANVGIFYSIHRPALVPDVFLSLDVVMPEDWWQTSGRSYLMWEHGKPPEVVIEIVSNVKGGELGRRRQDYARMRVLTYVVFDPDRRIQDEQLAVYQLGNDGYVETAELWLPAVQLGLTLWEGSFENRHAVWLRWCGEDGQLIPTGQERAEQERARAEQERTRAEQEHTRAERLTTQLRALGIEPDA